MELTKAFSRQSLIVTVLFNLVLVVLIYFMGGDDLQEQALAVFGTGLVVTLVLWLVLRQVGRKLIERAAAAPAPPPSAPAPRPEPKTAAPALPPTTSAVQILSLLQRQGRLIDFLQEDLQAYDDAQIGAAVRNVHAGCREALAEHVELEPIFEVPEGSTVTVAPGFDAHAIRLTGRVEGEPPFKGTLQHRGWRVKRVDLPALMPGQGQEMVITAAEVEV